MPLDDNPFIQGMRRKTLDALRYADGGSVTDDDGMIRLGPQPGQFNQRTIFLGSQPGQFHESLPARHPATRYQRENAMRAPQVDVPDTAPPQPPARSFFQTTTPPADPAAPQQIAMPTTTGDSLYPQNLSPDWLNNATLNSLQQPFSMPVTGGSPMNLSDMVSIPQNKWEAGALAAGALPLGKVLKGGSQALKLGTAALEGAEPEVGALSRALESEPSALSGVTPGEPNIPPLSAADVLTEAAKKKKMGYSDWERKNPGAEAGMFDYENAEPAPIGAERGQLERYDPKRGTSARLKDALNNPKVAAAMQQAVEDGAQVLPENWYRTGPLYKTFETVLGPDRAPAAYERLMQFVAGTSPRSRVPDNLRTASYYYYLDRNNLPLPAKPAAGYGSVAQKLHLQNIANIQEQGGLNPLQNPKPASFSENLLGNESVLTSDTHNFRFIGMASEDPRFLANSAQIQVGETAKGKPIYNTIKPRQMYYDGKLTMEEALQNPTYWDSAPAKNEYKAVEDHQRALAQQMNLPLADFQGKLWVGGGFPSASRSWHTGLGSPPESFLRTFGKRVQYTAARLGASPEDVLHKFVLGEIPLLGLGAGAVGAAALAPHGQQPAASDQGLQ